MSREVILPSKALLKITPAPFADSRALYQALLKELKDIPVNSSMEVMNLYKELFCTGFSSLEIEKALWKCMERCTYNDKGHDVRITPMSFEPVENREDYVQVAIEVARENVEPFFKSLFVQYKTLSEMNEKNLK
jgi:hypothetical protein